MQDILSQVKQIVYTLSGYVGYGHRDILQFNLKLLKFSNMQRSVLAFVEGQRQSQIYV